MSETQKHTKPNVPNLRFPGFEGEWEWETNEKLFNVSKEKNRGGKYSSVLSASQSEGMIERSSLGIDIKYEEDSVLGYKVVHPGDYVIHLRSFQGGFAFSNRTGICSPAYTILQPSPSLSYGFLSNYFTSQKFIDSLRIVTYGIRDGKSISVDEWLKLSTCFPKALEEQRKIKAFLSLLDERITLQNKVIEDLRVLNKAIMTRLFQSTDGEIITLGELTVNFSNRNKQRIPYPMFSVTNDKGFIPQCEQFEDREMEGEDIAAYKLIRAGDIAYNPARINVGSIAQYKGKMTCMISSLYVCIQAKRTVSDRWLMHILKSDRLLYYYNLYAEGGVRLYLFYPNFSRIKVLVPPFAKQERIADCLDAIDNKIEQESALLNNLMKQKQFFLSRLFLY